MDARSRSALRSLERDPSASPRELAQIIGRSLSWVKKWCKRLAKGDPHDSSLFCSHSRAHHTPYFHWDFHVIQRIVEMRLSPPENLNEQPALEAVMTFLQKSGCPRQMTFDRDPRWVGGVSGRDFPSPLRRLLLCLGVKPHLCPPHRPDKNAFVKRFHRTYGQECLHIHQPSTLQEVREVTEAFLQHYNYERPHQGRARPFTTRFFHQGAS